MSRQFLSETEFPSQARRLWFWIAAISASLAFLAAASCHPQRSLADRAPLTVPEQGAKWNRTRVEPISSGDLVPGAVAGTRLTYSGPLPITVDLYQMPSSGSAFEAAQRWRTAPGKSIAYRNDLFLVVNCSQPDAARDFATPFLAALQ